MCGLGGFMVHDGAVPEALLDRLALALAHRGPDGEGRWLRGSVGMVHRRLSIIDLDTGAQPLVEPGGAGLVANGEVYNYVELQQALAGRLTSGSDCEPPLLIFRDAGLDFVQALRGMWAIALHDPAQGHLVLSRDPFGIKPLYYHAGESGLAFASTPSALLSSGLVSPKLREAAALELLQLHFTTGRETAFAGIDRVLPGETLVVGDGRVIERHQQQALPMGPPAAWDEDQALALLDSALTDSVMVHQRSDVPFAMFLSGGVDSSAILATMARLSDRPVVAFTAGFPGSAAADERAHAASVARAAGAEHIAIEVTAADFFQHLPQIVAAVDDPTADYAIVPTWLLAREAAKSFKVVLSGEGGDELFGGYGRYRARLRPWWLGGRALRPKGTLDGLDLLRQAPSGWRDGIVAAEGRLAGHGLTPLQQAQAVDCADWLPNDLLIKLDRCLMAHGLEGRTPFLDPRVAEVAFRLPDALKVQGRTGKYLLRRWLDRALPAADAFSTKKGFTVPVAEWIAGEGHRLGPLVARHPAIAALCLPERVEALFHPRGQKAGGKRAGQAAWTLLFFALWHRIHIERQRVEGDVFDILAGG
ncbi:asparagine synthase (glutamine-hydrolyzing) [Zavarzinia sp. CC-PAN008]|uniref:asparagine synthase (glutamine-hydrolyzing) n=1 Tax=Zavarzinia sp. CC-PAN008 TaxID=3243332 RepID=UPI003F746297